MIVALWAEEKCYKSTMALSFPKPLHHFDLDVGGFARASWRFQKDVDAGLITSESFPIPLQIEKLMGHTVDKSGSKITIKFPRKMVGMKETWQQFIVSFVSAVENPKARTLVIDSATQLWNICHKSHLQEKQEIQIAKTPHMDENDLRDSLLSIEYGPPNDKMRTIIYTARSYNKNLVLTHYPVDIYAEKMVGDKKVEYKTGDIKPDGFKDTQKLVDIVIKLDGKSDKDNKWVVTASVTKSALPGLGSSIVGIQLEPSYQTLYNLASNMGVELEPEYPNRPATK